MGIISIQCATVVRGQTRLRRPDAVVGGRRNFPPRAVYCGEGAS
jgi:hypothetical protein